MSSKFYISIIEEEKNAFNIKDDALMKAAKDVAKTYSSKALQMGSAYLDYNNPSNRCAYLFKFAAVHTGLVAKYFQQLTKKKEVLNIFNSKKHIRICCLGGGPGMDVVGIFKALAIIPSLHKKVVQVTILDICGGWRNSFKHVMSRLKHGKVGGVPASFIDSNDFKADLISVDLLKPLPENIKRIISSADVISMVKFVSAVLGVEGSIEALKVIATMTKPGATIFFIDNFQGKVFEALENISKDCGLDAALGPLHEVYISGIQKPSQTKVTAYGCLPTNSTRISAIGWIKTSEVIRNLNYTSTPSPTADNNEEDSWDTDSEDSYKHLQTKNAVQDFRSSKQINAPIAKIRLHKFTQTNIKDLSTTKIELAELPNLIEAVSDLLEVMQRLRLNGNTKKCCHRSLDT